MALDSSSDPFAKMLTILVLELSSVFSLFSHQVEESNSMERLVLITTSIAMLLVSLFLLYHIHWEYLSNINAFSLLSLKQSYLR